MNCAHCNDTGSLSKEAWGQLDCGHCEVAIERMAVEAWARRIAPQVMPHDVWAIYQRGKAAGKAAAAEAVNQ